MTAWADIAARHGGRTSFNVLAGLAFLFFLLMPFYNAFGPDVSYLAWTADRMLGGAVYGRDIFEINPPLCVLIYVPAALLAKVVGFEWGIRTWMLLITLLSLACLWQTAGKALRLPVAAVLLMFVTFAFPSEFGQREQIALLLCAPYVAGPAPDRRWGIVSGIMAGIGFAMKPYFLIPLAAVFAVRRRPGTEEWAILAVGAAYAVILLVFFQPYFRDVVPAAASAYWAVYQPGNTLVAHTAILLLATVPIAVASAPQPGARSYIMATLGFTVAAALQQKGFLYHFIPAYGFLALYFTVMTFNKSRAGLAALYLFLEAAFIAHNAFQWLWYYDSFYNTRAALQAEIDQSTSYLSFVPDPYPAFPLAIHSPSHFVGITAYPFFMHAVSQVATGFAHRDASPADRLALELALKELNDRPALVITLNNPFLVAGKPFDIMAWYNQDPRFRKAWKEYVPSTVIGPYLLYRRR